VDSMHYFLQIYGTLPRAGPGSNEATCRAMDLMSLGSAKLRLLDIGCGPGMQTVELLRNTSGTVVALDVFPSMLARVEASAERAGVADRLETLELDMNDMDFPSGSFDVIWSEGAIYFLGFESGLRKIREFVKPGGYVAVSEAVWLKPDPPAEVLEFWKEYPEIDTVANKLSVIERLGYESVGHFVLPPSAWTDEYYDPMEERIAEKEVEWKDVPAAAAVLDEARKEVATFRRNPDCFSYAFFVMRR
jgi:SAM-dependent methyltransferase